MYVMAFNNNLRIVGHKIKFRSTLAAYVNIVEGEMKQPNCFLILFFIFCIYVIIRDVAMVCGKCGPY